jgi:hypothetical protein
VAVEKLFPAKFAKIKSLQDAPRTTFSVFLDIFYPPNFGCFEKKGLFQQPRLITSTVIAVRAISFFKWLGHLYFALSVGSFVGCKLIYLDLTAFANHNESFGAAISQREHAGENV